MAVQLVCVRAFGTYKPGDLAAEVPEGAKYDTRYFAPRDTAPLAPPGPASKTLTAKEQREAALQAELAELENGDKE